MKGMSWQSRLRRGLPVIVAALIAAAPARSTTGCPTDCSGDRRVSIDELIRCVGVLLGSGTLAECPNCDSDGNGSVAINDLISGVTASLGTFRIVADGVCARPGPDGLISCAPGTRLRMLRCDDQETCLDDTGSGATLVSEVEIGSDGTWSIVADGCAVTAAALVMEAAVTSSTDYHVMVLGPAGAGGARLALGQTQPAPLSGLRISPASEAATQLVAETGLAAFDDTRLDALFEAVEAATAATDFAGLTAEAAAALALDVARDDPAVQAILTGPTATPTPTPTSIPAVEWIAGDGRWGDPSNWSGGATPGPDDVVRIAASGAPTITHDGGNTVVGALFVEDTLVVSAGTVTVRGSSLISGGLICSSALAAEGAGVLLDVTGTVDLDGCSLEARGGARIRAPGVTTYDADPTQTLQQRVWRASGADSAIELPNLVSVQAVDAGPARFSIEALSGGTMGLGNAVLTAGGFAVLADGTGSMIDLSSTPGIPRGALTVRNGGQIIAPLVTQLDGVEVIIAGATAAPLAQLTALTRGGLSVTAAAASYASLAALDGSSLQARDGGSIQLPAVQSFTADPDGVARQPSWTATGAGSLIRLANLGQAVGVSVGSASRFSVSASSGGAIELAMLAAIPNGHVALSAEGMDSRVDLAKLAVVPSGSALSALDGGALMTPLITTLDGVSLTRRGAGSIPIAQLTAVTRGDITVAGANAAFDALTALNGTGLQALEGASIALPAVHGFAADPDTAGRQPRWRAAGAGSGIILSALSEAVGVTVGAASRFFISAESGGGISAPVLTVIAIGRVSISAEGAASVVELPELSGIPTGSQLSAANGGAVHLPLVTQLDGVSLTLMGEGALPTSQLIQMTRGEINVTGTSAVFDGLLEMNGTTLRASSASIALPAVQGFIADPDSAARQPLWEADGTNSVISLPALGFVAGVSTGAASRFTVHAVRAGRVTLSALNFVQTGRVLFLAEDPNSVLDLSTLMQFDPAQVSIEARNGGTVLRPSP